MKLDQSTEFRAQDVTFVRPEDGTKVGGVPVPTDPPTLGTLVACRYIDKTASVKRGQDGANIERAGTLITDDLHLTIHQKDEAMVDVGGVSTKMVVTNPRRYRDTQQIDLERRAR